MRSRKRTSGRTRRRTRRRTGWGWTRREGERTRRTGTGRMRRIRTRRRGEVEWTRRTGSGIRMGRTMRRRETMRTGRTGGKVRMRRCDVEGVLFFLLSNFIANNCIPNDFVPLRARRDALQSCTYQILCSYRRISICRPTYYQWFSQERRVILPEIGGSPFIACCVQQ